jgi:hypothetical protein
MLDGGIPLRIVARWHGHDPVVAARTYDHPDPEALASAGQTFDARTQDHVSN